MIVRNYKEGQQLDVAGLNKITVLLDRSETEFTEIGHNEWRPRLDGPPHKHDDKDQVFYITSGVGIIKIGDESHTVQKGNIIYVPGGIVHQTITTGDEPLCYLLLNVFNDSTKEGHGTFEEHIEKVKLIRKEQADTQSAGEGLTSTNVRQSKFFNTIYEGKQYEFGSNQTILLLDRSETNRNELTLVIWPAGNKGAMVAHSEKEQSFFVIEGEGNITIGSETQLVKPGDLVFVPINTPHTTEAGDSKLIYLCLNSQIDNLKDASFDEMYQRIGQNRINRWKSGSNKIGE